MKLRMHIYHCPFEHPWVATIDDDLMPIPEDPYWFDSYNTVDEAIAAGCNALRQMYTDLKAVQAAGRISGTRDPEAGEPIQTRLAGVRTIATAAAYRHPQAGVQTPATAADRDSVRLPTMAGAA